MATETSIRTTGAASPADPRVEPAPAAFDPRAHPPEVLYLALPASDICNYRCRHCHIWMQEKRAGTLSRVRRGELVAEFARLSPGGSVVLPGGEVMLEPEEVDAVGAACRDAGLALYLLTNGSSLADVEAAHRLARSGVTHVAVSLDGATADLHDYTRGVPGAFATTTAAIRRLAEARDAVAPQLSVQTACVLFRENLASFPEYVELCTSLGARQVDFQMLARTFANRHRSRDVFFEKHFWHRPEEKQEAKRRITELLDRYAADPVVVKKPADLPWILAYIDDPDFRTAHPICGSHHRNLHVDAVGNVALCFNTEAILERPFVGNAAEESLEALWAGANAAEDRAVMDRCTLNCGALNCHRRDVAVG